ncbi:helix-turn-helix transcriptional regulator [Streptomyces sp. NK15101]|uniref:ArsR/SmtB family transcription factor n=1 Tax=Streptomyces sp. NK15101 TaxID=2873261 RepID=UPI001CEC1685|nr:helix-turn-helix transcriptional regulator [Streptomyces sp. NK15101]
MPEQPGATGHRAAPVHTHPDEVTLLTALSALADPVRIQLVRELASRPDWTLSCSNFDVPVGRAAKSHHFTVLRGAGLVEQRDQGPKRLNRLRREEFDARFPGLLELTLREDDLG